MVSQPPTAREVEEVVSAAARRGDWARAAALLCGAVKLQCVPTPRTYTTALVSTAMRGGWAAAVQLADRLQSSPLSARALLCVVADAAVGATVNERDALSTLSAISAAAMARGVPLAARHHAAQEELRRRQVLKDRKDNAAAQRELRQRLDAMSRGDVPNPHTETDSETTQSFMPNVNSETCNSASGRAHEMQFGPKDRHDATMLWVAAEPNHWCAALQLLRLHPSLIVEAKNHSAAYTIINQDHNGKNSGGNNTSGGVTTSAKDTTDARSEDKDNREKDLMRVLVQNWTLLWSALRDGLSKSSPDECITVAAAFARHMRHNTSSASEMSAAGRTVCAFVQQHAASGRLPVLNDFAVSACACGWWRDALAATDRTSTVFAALSDADGSHWEAALAVFAHLPPSAKVREGATMEHILIARGLWAEALRYAAKDPIAMRSAAIPLCAALGMWRHALTLLRQHVRRPTRTEWRLTQHCTVRVAEDSMNAATSAGDWCRALRTFEAFRRWRQRVTGQKGGRRRARRLSSRVLTPLGVLLLEHNQSDACCALLTADADVRVEKPQKGVQNEFTTLHCLRLFRDLRRSPLLYGRVLREAQTLASINGPATLAALNGYATLALAVAGNRSGAFAPLREAITADPTMLRTVPRLLVEVPSLLVDAADRSDESAAEAETLALAWTQCAEVSAETDALVEFVVSCWAVDTERRRGVALRVALALLRRLRERGSDAPLSVLRIAALGVSERPGLLRGAPAPWEMLFQFTKTHMVDATQSTQQEREEQQGKLGSSGIDRVCINTVKKETALGVMRLCTTGFTHAGNWRRALDAMQMDPSAPAESLFAAAVHLRDSNEDHRAKAERLAADATPGDEATLIALSQLHAWRSALALYEASDDKKTWSATSIGVLLSCVAKDGPWEEALRLLQRTTASSRSRAEAAAMEKGITDLLRAVQRGGGVVHSCRALLSAAEGMGVPPTAEQCDVLLEAFLMPELGVLERETCAAILTQLSRSLGEQRVMEFIIAIAQTSGRGANNNEEEEEDNEWEEDHAWYALGKKEEAQNRPSLRLRHRRHNRYHSQEGKHYQSRQKGVVASNWMPTQRPPLNDEELHRLRRLAPLIILATPRGLEGLSRGFLCGRFRPFELKMLLQHYKKELQLDVEGNDDSGGVNKGTKLDGGKEVKKTEMDEEGEKKLQQTGEVKTNNGVEALVEYCRGSHLLHVRLVPYEHRLSSCEDWPTVRNDIQQDIFACFVSSADVDAIWEACRPFVIPLSTARWPYLCEHELTRCVQKSDGRPPLALLTRPDASRAEIAAYWSTYGRILWPELFLSGPELCQLAVYVPLVEPLLRFASTSHDNRRNSNTNDNKQNTRNSASRAQRRLLNELMVDIQITHFAAGSIPMSESFLRQPRSASVIHTVFARAWKMLRRLHNQLDMDARDRRYYYHYHPDPTVWRRYEPIARGSESTYSSLSPLSSSPSSSSTTSSSSSSSTRLCAPRWNLALRILRQHQRATGAPLQARTIAALFAACAADMTTQTTRVEEYGKREAAGAEVEDNKTWWAQGIRCARSIEPTLTDPTWREAMTLAMPLIHRLSVLKDETKERMASDGMYHLEDIHDASLQATTRALIQHAERFKTETNPTKESGGMIPFAVSLLLVDRMKELLGPSSLVGKGERGCSDADGDDALNVWALLTSHCCWEKMNPVHVKLLKRLVQEGH